MKKILAFALVLAMTMALSLSVCAATIEGDDITTPITETITIQNTISGDAETVYSVDVEWSYDFYITTTSAGKWNPATHEYDDGAQPASTIHGSGKVSVTNHSNAPVGAKLEISNVSSAKVQVTAGADLSLENAATASYADRANAPHGDIAITVAKADGVTVINESAITFDATLTLSK